MSRCEYDPEKHAPATANARSNGFGGISLEWVSGCKNEATVSVGTDGKWGFPDLSVDTLRRISQSDFGTSC